jgi:four helix bundle protein
MGSASEVEYQRLLARDLAFLKPEDYEALRSRLSEVKKMLNSFIQELR